LSLAHEVGDIMLVIRQGQTEAATARLRVALDLARRYAPRDVLSAIQPIVGLAVALGEWRRAAQLQRYVATARAGAGFESAVASDAFSRESVALMRAVELRTSRAGHPPTIMIAVSPASAVGGNHAGSREGEGRNSELSVVVDGESPTGAGNRPQHPHSPPGVGVQHQLMEPVDIGLRQRLGDKEVVPGPGIERPLTSQGDDGGSDDCLVGCR
jgi:hypothetical protein